MTAGSWISILNATNAHIDTSLEQAGALYYANKIAPGHTVIRRTGAVWFTVKARYSDPHKAGLSDWSVGWPIAAAVAGAVAATVVFPPAGAVAWIFGGAVGAGTSMAATVAGVKIAQHFQGARVVESPGWYAAQRPTVRITGGARWEGNTRVYEPLAVERVEDGEGPVPMPANDAGFGGGYADGERMVVLQHCVDQRGEYVLQSVANGDSSELALHARGAVAGHPMYSQLWRLQQRRYTSERVVADAFIIRNVDSGEVLTASEGEAGAVTLAQDRLETDHEPSASQLWTVEEFQLSPDRSAYWIRNVETRFALCPAANGRSLNRRSFQCEEWMHTDRHFWLVQPQPAQQ